MWVYTRKEDNPEGYVTIFEKTVKSGFEKKGAPSHQTEVPFP